MWVCLFNFGFTPLGQTVQWDTKHFILSKLAKQTPPICLQLAECSHLGAFALFCFSLLLLSFFSSQPIYYILNLHSSSSTLSSLPQDCQGWSRTSSSIISNHPRVWNHHLVSILKNPQILGFHQISKIWIFIEHLLSCIAF